LQGAEKRRVEALRRKCAARGLVSAWHGQHSGEVAWTRQATTQEGKGRSQIDHALVSERLLEAGAVKRIGVMEGEQLNMSDHRTMVMDIDVRTALGMSGLPEKRRRGKLQAVVIKQKATVVDFVQRINMKLAKADVEQEMAELKELVEGWEDTGGVRRHAPPEITSRLFGFQRHLKLVVQCERDMEEAAESKTSRRRRNGWSAELGNKSAMHRRMGLVLRSAKRGLWRRAMKLHQCGKTRFN